MADEFILAPKNYLPVWFGAGGLEGQTGRLAEIRSGNGNLW
jgi:hypothetical protein